MLQFSDTRREQMALAGLSLSLLMSSLDTSIANASLPMLAHAYGASFQQAQWIVLAYLLAVTSLTVVAGRLGDVVGRRRLLLSATALFTVTSIMCAAAPTLWVLIVGRAVQGVFAATMMALAIAVVGDVSLKAHVGIAMGRLAAMSAIGTTVGPAIGSLLHGFGATAIFLVNVPFGVLAFALLRRYLPSTRSQSILPVRFDVTGTLLLAVTLVSYALSMTLGRGHWTALNTTLLSASAVSAVVFVFIERHAVSPLVPIVMFLEPGFSVSLAANTVVSTVMMATLIVGPFYLSRGLSLSAASIGLVLSIGPATAALTASAAGRLVSWIGASRTAIGGLGAIAAGALVLTLLPRSLGVIGYIVPLVVMTSGYAVFQTANNTNVMAGADDERRGVVAGLLGLSRNLGLITGASVMGAIFLHASGATELAAAQPDAIATGMRTTFGVAALLVTSLLVVTTIHSQGE